SAQATRASKLATRALIYFGILLVGSAITAALLTPLLLDRFPLPTESAAKLRDSLTGNVQPGRVPGFSDFVRSIIPTNPIDAASRTAILPLIVFVLIFAFAMIRLPKEPRET